MMIPTVHLNGTSREELVRQIERAYEHLDKAMDALAQAAPHGRDYYTQGMDAYQKAAAEHESRMARLHSVHKELEQIVEALFE